MIRVLVIVSAISIGAVVGLAQQQVETSTPAAATPAPSEAARLRKELDEALDALAVARAQRGDCEATLAPLESQARRVDSERRWAAAKAALELERPGHDCNPRTLECVKKLEPPKKDESK